MSTETFPARFDVAAWRKRTTLSMAVTKLLCFHRRRTLLHRFAHFRKGDDNSFRGYNLVPAVSVYECCRCGKVWAESRYAQPVSSLTVKEPT